MKLGVETGSLVNSIMSRGSQEIIPVVGMGVTELCWSDRHPYTIIEVSKTGKTITIQKDKSIRVDKNGMSDSQDYTYERDEKGTVAKARKNRNGNWQIMGIKSRIILDKRERYYDFSF